MNSLEIEKHMKKRHDSRMYSFKQLFNIVTTVANHSTINDRLCNVEENVRKIFIKLDEQTKSREDFKEYTDDLNNKVMMKMSNM